MFKYNEKYFIKPTEEKTFVSREVMNDFDLGFEAICTFVSLCRSYKTIPFDSIEDLAKIMKAPVEDMEIGIEELIEKGIIWREKEE